MKDCFDLEEIFNDHIKLCGIDPTKVNGDQLGAFKRFYFAGIKAMLAIININLPSVTDKIERTEKIKSINDQVAKFWEDEAELLKTRRQILGKKAVPKIISLNDPH